MTDYIAEINNLAKQVLAHSAFPSNNKKLTQVVAALRDSKSTLDQFSAIGRLERLSALDGLATELADAFKPVVDPKSTSTAVQSVLDQQIVIKNGLENVLKILGRGV